MTEEWVARFIIGVLWAITMYLIRRRDEEIKGLKKEIVLIDTSNRGLELELVKIQVQLQNISSSIEELKTYKASL